MASRPGAISVAVLKQRWTVAAPSTPWLPKWSKTAAIRGVRAAVVMPGLFAISDQVIGNLQMALFTAFGSVATLVLVSFAGTRRDKLIAHLGLAVAGTVLLTIGTAVNSPPALAAIVTVPVAFVIFFSGVTGPNAAAGALGAMVAYVLPASSAGTLSVVPDRLAGWWLASVVGTAAVLLFPTPAAASKLLGAATKLASTLADVLDQALGGEPTEAGLQAAVAAKHDLLSEFNATPYRPVGLAVPDQALMNAVELLEWGTSLVVDSVHERDDLSGAAPADRELLACACRVLRQAAALFAGGKEMPDLEALDAARKASSEHLAGLTPGTDSFREQAQLSYHVHAIAATVLLLGADAAVGARLRDADWIYEARRRWFGGGLPLASNEHRLQGVSKYTGVAFRHASVRSVWFINSLRGALALAAAVLVADLSDVQHGFWVVLGTLSVLRTNASGTGSTALRALLGTAGGFAIGAALLLAIGSSTTALWVVFPIAVLVMAYAPGVAPFAVGQAAFTITIAVLFNLLIPVGWKVGEIRIEDVALGCAVSVLVGILFWPRGVSTVVGEDLADAYRKGSSYLVHAVEWVSGLRPDKPSDAMPAIAAGLRLDDALRGYLAEQGSKRAKKEDLWRLVGGSLRLRLTAHAVSSLPRDATQDPPTVRAVIGRRAERISAFYDELADELSRSRGPVVKLTPPDFDGADGAGGFDGPETRARSQEAIWLCEHLDHLTEHLHELVTPAADLAEVRRRPWWR